MDATLFSSLTTEQKIDFFVHCQRLLVKYHSNSPFVLRENKLAQTLESFAKHITDYKGYYYSDENICVLFNYIYVDDTSGPNKVLELRRHAYAPAAENYNGVSIDFVVVRQMTDNLEFIRKKDEPQIKHILFVKDGKIRLHKKDDILKKLPLGCEN